MTTYIIRDEEDASEYYFSDRGMRVLHREDGPAAVCSAYTAWYLNGLRHRVDGPAEVNADGSKRWFVKGAELSQSEFENWRTGPEVGAKTPMTDAEYLACAAQKCPYCGSEDIRAHDTGISTDCVEAWQNVECASCGRYWDEIFKMVGYADSEKCTKD